jgi:hypothetical protein
MPPAAVRIARWAAWSAPAVALFVLIARPRPDLTSRLADGPFLLSFCAIVALSLASAALAIGSSVPRDGGTRAVRAGPLVLAAVWGSLLLVRLAAGEGVLAGLASDPGHAVCALQIALMALLPAVVLLREARAGAAVAPSWTGIFVVIAASSAGAVGSALICPIDQPAHQLLWHFLPVVTLAVVGPMAGRRWLTRFDRA